MNATWFVMVPPNSLSEQQPHGLGVVAAGVGARRDRRGGRPPERLSVLTNAGGYLPSLLVNTGPNHSADVTRRGVRHRSTRGYQRTHTTDGVGASVGGRPACNSSHTARLSEPRVCIPVSSTGSGSLRPRTFYTRSNAPARFAKTPQTATAPVENRTPLRHGMGVRQNCIGMAVCI